MRLGIFLPTYKRPDKLRAVAENIERTTKSDYTLYFGCEATDTKTIEAAQMTGHHVVINVYDPTFGYSNTIQSIYELSRDEVFFHANDDFEFLDGWDVDAMSFLEAHPEIMVVGANDGMPTPSYSTLSFVRREYIERYSGVIDIPDRVFFPYHHNYTDTEFTRTAQARGVWAKIESPCIKHHRVGGDETYQKNDVTSPVDQETFKSREHLWEQIKEEDKMPRKPMSEAQKQNLRDKAKARAEAKKAEQASTAPEMPANETQGMRPEPSSTPHGAMAERALEHMEKAADILIMLRNQNPGTIEAVQAVDALTEAMNRTGQVQGILANK